MKTLPFDSLDKDAKKELSVLKKLSTPAKIQDFLNALPFNFEKKGETYRSVAETLKAGEAHCFEGALVAAAAFWMHGEKPLLLDLKTKKSDVDHVVALFTRKAGKKTYWGALSKTNHGVLRYREPVYASVRELAMSYFHEYFLPDGAKTLASFSEPFDLSMRRTGWISDTDDQIDILNALDASPHEAIVPKELKLRRADPVEIEMGDIVEWMPNR